MSKALYSVLFRPVGCVHSGKGRKAEKPKVTQPADSDEEGPLLLGKSREGLEDRHLTDISRLLSGLLQNRGLWEGRGADSPLTPGPQRCYRPDPGKILPGFLCIPAWAQASFTATGRQPLFMAAPFSGPVSRPQRHLARLGGLQWEGGFPPLRWEGAPRPVVL